MGKNKGGKPIQPLRLHDEQPSESDFARRRREFAEAAGAIKKAQSPVSTRVRLSATETGPAIPPPPPIASQDRLSDRTLLPPGGADESSQPTPNPNLPGDGVAVSQLGRTESVPAGSLNLKEAIGLLLAVAAIAAGVVIYQDTRISELSRDVKESLSEFRRELREDQVELRTDVRDHDDRLQKLENQPSTPTRAGSVPRTP